MSAGPVTVSVPASSANLGPGFDVLALALALRNTVALEAADADELAITGEGSDGLALDSRNLVHRAATRLYEHIGRPRPSWRLAMNNTIPLSRGLGSSSAAIVGGLVAANRFSGADISKDDLFPLAVELEGHPDNVAAALYGGLTVSYRQDSSFAAVSLTPRIALSILLLVPPFKLSTAAARAALPDGVSYDDAVFNIGRGCLLMALLLGGKGPSLRAALEDRLHQQYRSKLIDGFEDMVDICYKAGAAGVALSGAGPTVIVFIESDNASTVEGSIRRAITEGDFAIKRPGYRVLSAAIDLDGAVLLE